MKIKDLIKDSVYCTIGYADEKHLETLSAYIEQNKFLLEQFDEIKIFYNGDSDENCYKAEEIWNKSLKTNTHNIQSLTNRGHTFGTMDLDNMVINFSKKVNKKYIWKTSVDTVFFPQILNKNIPEADFYYLQGIGYSGLSIYDKNYFFPQTNFYIIKNKIDYLNDEKEIDEVYKLQQENPNKKPWELKQGFESETFLKRCIERNRLTKYHLIGDYQFLKLKSIIEKHKIHDSSHKNIIIGDPGVCHLQWPEQPSYSIDDLYSNL